MLRLGQFSYGNCVPLHGRFLRDGAAAPPTASAMSGALLKIIMRQRIGIRPERAPSPVLLEV
ncbi:MAG: hypothetical protein JSV86_11830 [Gemmatimonadota bacterium]|nr:MAG: hypothetical protein JSV86_11830 [Gemmatimonadota bacterium]